MLNDIQASLVDWQVCVQVWIPSIIPRLTLSRKLYMSSLQTTHIMESVKFADETCYFVQMLIHSQPTNTNMLGFNNVKLTSIIVGPRWMNPDKI